MYEILLFYTKKAYKIYRDDIIMIAQYICIQFYIICDFDWKNKSALAPTQSSTKILIFL